MKAALGLILFLGAIGSKVYAEYALDKWPQSYRVFKIMQTKALENSELLPDIQAYFYPSLVMLSNEDREAILADFFAPKGQEEWDMLYLYSLSELGLLVNHVLQTYPDLRPALKEILLARLKTAGPESLNQKIQSLLTMFTEDSPSYLAYAKAERDPYVLKVFERYKQRLPRNKVVLNKQLELYTVPDVQAEHLPAFPGYDAGEKQIVITYALRDFISEKIHSDKQYKLKDRYVKVSSMLALDAFVRILWNKVGFQFAHHFDAQWFSLDGKVLLFLASIEGMDMDELEMYALLLDEFRHFCLRKAVVPSATIEALSQEQKLVEQVMAYLNSTADLFNVNSGIDFSEALPLLDYEHPLQFAVRKQIELFLS